MWVREIATLVRHVRVRSRRGPMLRWPVDVYVVSGADMYCMLRGIAYVGRTGLHVAVYFAVRERRARWDVINYCDLRILFVHVVCDLREKEQMFSCDVSR